MQKLSVVAVGQQQQGTIRHLGNIANAADFHMSVVPGLNVLVVRSAFDPDETLTSA